MRTANQVIASERLRAFSELLLATGWSRDVTGGYLAPEHMRSDVAQQYGAGHLHLWDALNAQARFDSFVVNALIAA